MPIEPTPQQVAELMAQYAASTAHLTPPSGTTGQPQVNLATASRDELEVMASASKQGSLNNDQMAQLVDALVAGGCSREAALEAARLDGYTPAPPMTAEQRAMADWGLNPSPQPSDYTFDLPDTMARTLDGSRQQNVRAALGDMVAAVGLDSVMGSAVARFVAEEGPRVRAMGEDAKRTWLSQQHKSAVSLLGSEAAVAVATEKAVKLLQGSPLGAQIAASDLGRSTWLTVTLATHSDNLQRFNQRKK